MSNTTEPFIPGFDTCSAGVSEICPVEATLFGSYLNTGASAFFTATYALLLAAQFYLTYKSKAWTFSAWFTTGCIIELVGCVGRILLSKNPWSFGAFVVQNLTLVTGPTFITATTSITFKHLVMWYGPEFSLTRPVLLPWVLVGTGCISIGIQGAGGAISSSASGPEDRNMMGLESNLLVAGVAFQVANMVNCGALMLVYAHRRWLNRKRGIVNSSPSTVSVSLSSRSHRVMLANTPHSTPRLREGGRWPFTSGLSWSRTSPSLYAASIGEPPISSPFLHYNTAVSRLKPTLSFCAASPRWPPAGAANSSRTRRRTFLVLDGAMILGAGIILTVFHAHFFFPYLSKAKREGEKAAAEGEGVELRADGYAKCC